jgi:hypothetical protein
MVIRASSAGEIRALVDALAGADTVRREAALARLAVIGARAVDRLLAAYPTAPDRRARIAILRALEPIRDPRPAPIAAAALRDGGDLAVAAAAVLRGLLDSPHDPASSTALDALVSCALDASAERRVRLAAFDALQDMPEDVRARVAGALDAGAPAGLPRPLPGQTSEVAAIDALWMDVVDGRLPDDPVMLREAVASKGGGTPLSALRRIIDAIRAREAETAAAARKAEWCGVRGALHQALALRGSRIALYDLRETIAAAAAPLPSTFLTAVHAVGDPSCLEALAGAYARAPEAETAWRSQLASAFRAIAKRERVTRRHAAMKRVAARWPRAADWLR